MLDPCLEEDLAVGVLVAGRVGVDLPKLTLILITQDIAPITRGPKWCYDAYHTIKPLPDHDQRGCRDDMLVLFTGPDLQSQIDQIPTTHPNVSILTIQSRGCLMTPSNIHLRYQCPN
jgi:hypothetical protein